MFFRKTKDNMMLRYGALVAFVVMVVTNALANILPINSQTTGQVSDAYPNLFAPAGVTFSIWGLIYVALGLYTLYRLRFLKVKKPQIKTEVHEQITPLFILSSLLNAAWIFTWHYDAIGLSVVCMLGLLVTLIRIHQLVVSARKNTSELLLVQAPFSIYFGWITVATIANITTWLVSVQWDGWGIAANNWMVIMALVGALLGLVVSRRVRDPIYLLVYVWAYLGILLKHVSGEGFGGRYPEVILTVTLCIAMFSAYAAYLYADGKRK